MQINNLKIIDNTYFHTGIPNFRGLSYVVRTPDGRNLEEFQNRKGTTDAMTRAQEFCKRVKDFARRK